MTSSLMVYRRKKKHQPSAVVLRKYRRLRRRQVGLKKEYKKLRALLPQTEKEKEMKKVGVVEAAYRYICELQDALLDKFSSKGVPEDLAGVVCGKVTSTADIQALAVHLIKNSSANGDHPILPWPSSFANAGGGGSAIRDGVVKGETGNAEGGKAVGGLGSPSNTVSQCSSHLLSSSSTSVPSSSSLSYTEASFPPPSFSSTFSFPVASPLSNLSKSSPDLSPCPSSLLSSWSTSCSSILSASFSSPSSSSLTSTTSSSSSS